MGARSGSLRDRPQGRSTPVATNGEYKSRWLLTETDSAPKLTPWRRVGQSTYRARPISEPRRHSSAARKRSYKPGPGRNQARTPMPPPRNDVICGTRGSFSTIESGSGFNRTLWNLLNVSGGCPGRACRVGEDEGSLNRHWPVQPDQQLVPEDICAAYGTLDLPDCASTSFKEADEQSANRSQWSPPMP